MDTPAIRGLNHLTLAVANLPRSIHFYRDILGCTLRAQWQEGAYLEAGVLWLCLSLEPTVNAREDYTHFAFDVEEEGFCQLKELIVRHAIVWKDDVSEGHSLYFLDPDGHKLELHIGTLNTRLAHYARAGMNVSIFE